MANNSVNASGRERGLRTIPAHRSITREETIMTGLSISRRSLVAGAAAAALSGLMPRASRAAGTLAATIYPGPWEEAYRSLVAPRVKQAHGIDVQFYPLLSADQIAKARAARNEAAFDVFTLDPGPRVNAMDLNLFQPFDKGKLASAAKLPPALVDQHGVAVAGQLVGIAYNPKKLDRPRGWTDLFQPKFDWIKINAVRPQWIDRFNREVVK